ncbi:hypothetical protein D9M68_922450 [compost metagenome]
MIVRAVLSNILAAREDGNLHAAKASHLRKHVEVVPQAVAPQRNRGTVVFGIVETIEDRFSASPRAQWIRDGLIVNDIEHAEIS